MVGLAFRVNVLERCRLLILIGPMSSVVVFEEDRLFGSVRGIPYSDGPDKSTDSLIEEPSTCLAMNTPE